MAASAQKHHSLTGMRSLFLLSRLLKGRGRYFLGVAELGNTSERGKIKADEKYNITSSSLRNITTDYSLRIITDTALYLNTETGQWQSDGLRVSGGGGGAQGRFSHTDKRMNNCQPSAFRLSYCYSQYFCNQKLCLKPCQ